MIVFKLQYEDDIRRISLDEVNDNITVADLVFRIQSMFPGLASVPCEKLFIVYKDEDGDDIRITNDMELLEAVSTVQPDDGVKVLRLRIRGEGRPSNNQPINGTAASVLAQLCNASPSTQVASPIISHVVATLLPNTNPGSTVVLSNMLQNIGAALPVEQITPVVLNLMQSQPIQQIIPQLISSFFGQLQNQVPTQQGGQQMDVDATKSSVPSSQPEEQASVSTDVASEYVHETKDAATEVKVETMSVCTSTVLPSVSSIATSTSNLGMVDVATETTSAPVSPAVGSFTGSKFGDMILQLQELGFTNAEKNVKLLAKHGGDMGKAIDELIADQ